MGHDDSATAAELGRGQVITAILLAWLLSVGFDFLLHGGLLADAYRAEHPALLEPAEAFRRVPLGYATFLVLTVALWWLLARLQVRGWLAGARLGLLAGLLVWGALAVGLYSITTLGAGLLTGWWVGQGAELALAGAVLGAARAGVGLRRIGWRVGAAFLLLVAATIALQSLAGPTH